MSPVGAGVRIRQVVHIYRSLGQDVAALSGVDLDIAAGELVGLLGPSGAGKSTLLNLLAGLATPSAGRIQVGEIDVVDLRGNDLDRYRATVASLMLQGGARNLLRSRTVRENVTFAQRAARHHGHAVPDLPEVLSPLGLADDADTFVDDLAPATQQLVALAAALACAPQLLLVDEPTDRLDRRDADRVVQALAEVGARTGATTIVVSHDKAVTDALPRTVTIRDGRVGGEGRRGEEFSVVTGDHAIPVPTTLQHLLPAGLLVHFVERDGRVEIVPVRDDTGPGLGTSSGAGASSGAGREDE